MDSHSSHAGLGSPRLRPPVFSVRRGPSNTDINIDCGKHSCLHGRGGAQCGTESGIAVACAWTDTLNAGVVLLVAKVGHWECCIE